MCAFGSVTMAKVDIAEPSATIFAGRWPFSTCDSTARFITPHSHMRNWSQAPWSYSASIVRSKILARSARWSESFCPEPGVLMMSTSSPWSPKKPSSRATSNGRSWIAFITDALTFFIPSSSRNGDCHHLLPGAVVDRVLVGRARHGHVPLHRPAVGVVPALARVGLWRGVQQPPGLELFRLEQAAGLADEVVDIRTRILLELPHGARLGAEHFLQGLAIEIVARRFGARRMRFDEDAHAPLLGDADPRFHQARGGHFLVAHGF